MVAPVPADRRRPARQGMPALGLLAAILQLPPLALSPGGGDHGSAGAVACAAPATGFCAAPCDVCCADFTAAECDACVRAECEAPHRCVGAGDDAPCNVCDGCCDTAYLTTQHSCDACVNATCAAAEAGGGGMVCESHGTKTSPAQCSMDCLEECWLSPSSPCVQDCAENHGWVLLVLVLLPFIGRLVVDYVLGVIAGALCGTGGEQEEHAVALRGFCMRAICCRAPQPEPEEPEPEPEPELRRSTSVASRESTLIQHIKRGLDLDSRTAEERTRKLMDAGSIPQRNSTRSRRPIFRICMDSGRPMLSCCCLRRTLPLPWLAALSGPALTSASNSRLTCQLSCQSGFAEERWRLRLFCPMARRRRWW